MAGFRLAGFGRTAGGHHPVALEQAHAQQQRQGHLAFHRPQDAGVLLDVAQFGFQGRQPALLHQIAFVEQDHVAVDDLGARHLPLQDLLAEVLGIHQGDDRIQAGEVAQVAAKEGHRNRQGVGQPRGFHHQVVHLLRPFQDPVHRFQQFAVDRAADAAVAELHHVLAGGHHQLVVDSDLPELVHQHRGLEAVLIAEDVVEQSRLAGAQKAGEDCHGQPGGGGIDHGGAAGAAHQGIGQVLVSLAQKGRQSGLFGPPAGSCGTSRRTRACGTAAGNRRSGRPAASPRASGSAPAAPCCRSPRR